MQFLKNRGLSFLILLVVYVIAGAAGIIFYDFVNGTFISDYRISLLAADVFATIIVFIFSLVFRNASVYDPYWSVQPIVILAVLIFRCDINLLGVLLMVAVFYWGIRLTANWAYTFGDLTCQDWRYTMLHETCGVFYPFINFVGIHLVPTLVVYLCILPAFVAIVEGALFKPLCIAFLLMSITAATIQLFADFQMHSYRKNKTSNFIRTGLWKHARHPNYFGEILMWWGIGLCCVYAMPGSWYLLSGAICNTLLFSCISIPLAEKRQSKKEGFAEYKKATRILI